MYRPAKKRIYPDPVHRCPHCSFTTLNDPNFTAHLRIHQNRKELLGEY